MESLPDKRIYVVSTRSMGLLNAYWVKTLALKMSWSEHLQDVFVYANISSTVNQLPLPQLTEAATELIRVGK